MRWAVCRALLLACLLTSCDRARDPGASVTVDWELSPQPARVGSATLRFSLAEPSGQPLVGAQARVEGNMTHPGMKPVFGNAVEISPGRYEVPLELTMGGDWYILINAALADGREIQEKIDLPGVRAQ